jgi:hypothetical protein
LDSSYTEIQRKSPLTQDHEQDVPDLRQGPPPSPLYLSKRQQAKKEKEVKNSHRQHVDMLPCQMDFPSQMPPNAQ